MQYLSEKGQDVVSRAFSPDVLFSGTPDNATDEGTNQTDEIEPTSMPRPCNITELSNTSLCPAEQQMLNKVGRMSSISPDCCNLEFCCQS